MVGRDSQKDQRLLMTKTNFAVNSVWKEYIRCTHDDEMLLECKENTASDVINEVIRICFGDALLFALFFKR